MGKRRLPYWTCKRQKQGVKCLQRNGNRLQKCTKCGGLKPRRSPAKHLAALNESYEFFVEINGGEHCGICGTTVAERSTPGKKFQRDHAHTTTNLGEPRGLLCTACNMRLGQRLTLEWMEAACEYLRRHARRMEALERASTEDDWEADVA